MCYVLRLFFLYQSWHLYRPRFYIQSILEQIPMIASLVLATKKGKAFVEIEEDHSEEEMDAEEAEEVIL